MHGMEMKMKDLVEIIKANPGAVAVIDNDSWTLWKQHPDNAPDDDNELDDWEAENKLASDDDIEPLGDGGYGSGNCYGGDVLQALALIVGIRVESV
jgi:hypothetical protein